MEREAVGCPRSTPGHGGRRMSVSARLVALHLEDLAGSGLSTDIIVRSNVYSASPAEVAAILGYGAGPGMAFPYPVNGHGSPFVRIKLDRAGNDGKRYRTPKGAANHLYAPPLIVTPEQLADPSLELFITEGEKKSLRLNQEGKLAIGLAGVSISRTKLTPTDENTVPLPELDAIAWRGRAVFIVFDADARPKTVATVRRAEAKLAVELMRRGATVASIRLPLPDGAEKTGVDDYLLSHTIEEFDALPHVPFDVPAWTPPDGRPEISTEMLLDAMAGAAWGAVEQANAP